jgi:hypothetical protein
LSIDGASTVGRCRYNTASQIKKKQDDYCSKALSDEWDGLGDFPDDLQWDALVDVLRGRVKVSLEEFLHR